MSIQNENAALHFNRNDTSNSLFQSFVSDPYEVVLKVKNL